MKKLIWAAAVIIVAAVAYFWLRPSAPQESGPIKIGASTILTGDFAAAGENIVNSARLTAERINAAGGINGRMIELYIEDAQCDSKGGINAASKLINFSGVKYIVGGTCSNGTLAAAPLANERRVLYLTPVTGGKNNDEAGEYVFRTANSDLLAGRDIAQAMIKLGHKRVGVIAEITEYTLDIKQTFEKTIPELGGAVVISEEFQPGTKDFKTIIVKMKSAKPQAILIASQTGIGGATFIKQAKELDFNPPTFADFTLVVNEDAKKIVGSFEGIYFADPAYDADDPEVQAFFEEQERKSGKPPLIPFHSAATHDDIQMLAAAIQAVGDDSEKVHDWLLANIKNWKGYMGIYSLDTKGNSDIGFVIKIIQNDKPVKVFD